jgi:hypothetical protein
MAILSEFGVPANLSDFTPPQRKAWSSFIAAAFQQNIREVERQLGAGARSPFYDPTVEDTSLPSAEKVIRWKGFPLLIAAEFPGDRKKAWQAAEQLSPEGERPQDEYLEWFVERKGGKVVRVTFTCEGPEYWEALAEGYPRSYDGPRDPEVIGDRDKLLALYRQFVHPEVQLADLFTQGGYDPLNKWNSTHGAMHLNQRNNTLGAEINIAAQATILRQRGGNVLEDPDALIDCARYGAAGRASDPRIGAEVNALAREGFAITLQDPVGLYIDGLDTSGWTTPDGTPASQFWTILRGSPERIVRAVYEVPPTAGYTVGDIEIAGEPIAFGGQIAEQVTVKLTGVACRKGSRLNPPQPCVGAQGLVRAAAGVLGRRRG